jgi:hypothetical protein
MIVRAIVAALMAACCTGAEAVENTMGDADKAFAAGLAAYDSALAASALSDNALVIKELNAASVQFDKAEALYRVVLAGDSRQESARTKLFEIREIGMPCCHKKSLWEEYDVPRHEAERGEKE